MTNSLLITIKEDGKFCEQMINKMKTISPDLEVEQRTKFSKITLLFRFDHSLKREGIEEIATYLKMFVDCDNVLFVLGHFQIKTNTTFNNYGYYFLPKAS